MQSKKLRGALENSWRLHEIQSSVKLSKKNQKMGYSGSTANSPRLNGFIVDDNIMDESYFGQMHMDEASWILVLYMVSL
ncbi:hypothetical protein Bca4012_010242 [Brassica carinata]